MTVLITDIRLLKQHEGFFLSPTEQVQTSHWFFQFQHVDGFDSLLHKLYFNEAVIMAIMLIKTRNSLWHMACISSC